MAMLDGLKARMKAFDGMGPDETGAVIESLVWLVITEPNNDPHTELFAFAMTEIPTIAELTDDQRADYTREAIQRLDALEAHELMGRLVELSALLKTDERRVLVLAIASVVSAAGGSLGETRKLLLSRMGQAFAVPADALGQAIRELAGEA